MASTNSFIVSGLGSYVQENRDLLLKNFALVGTETRRRISVQTGVKKDAHINLLDITAVLGDGSSCGFEATSYGTLTQRTISTAAVKVNLQICDKTLLGKYAEYLVRMSATDNPCPFEEYVIDGLTAEINKAIEKLIWQGDTSQTSDASIKWIDGFLEIASDDLASGNKVSISSGTSAYNGILAVYAKLSEEALERDPEVYVSPAIYRTFLQEMVVLNYFHYAGPQAAYPNEFYVPGTNLKVVKTPGLAGSLKILATFPRNLYYGCDMEGDAEDIDIWWSQDDRVWKFAAEWNCGVQIAFPAHAVLGTFAAAPTVPLGVIGNLAAIAASQDAVADVMDDVHDSTNHAIKTKAAA
jgi:hypothetical protein